MTDRRLFTRKQYILKCFNTFLPRIIHQISPVKYKNRKHWKIQNLGDLHGYEKYCIPHPRIPFLVNEVNDLITKEDSILDLGCNCGYYLSILKNNGYSSLSGVDISGNAIEYGRKNLDLADVDLFEGSFEEILPKLIDQNKNYDLVYSMGATIELIHPSFDIIKSICELSNKYVILSISEWGHSYPRFYEYEFNKHGFLQVKAIRPYSGYKENIDDPKNITSMLIFKKI